MPTLHIKNIPPVLHSSLKSRAAANHRSLNREAIRALQAGIDTTAHETGTDNAGPAPEIAVRLRALKALGDSLSSRKVDFEEWRQGILDARR